MLQYRNASVHEVGDGRWAPPSKDRMWVRQHVVLDVHAVHHAHAEREPNFEPVALAHDKSERRTEHVSEREPEYKPEREPKREPDREPDRGTESCAHMGADEELLHRRLPRDVAQELRVRDRHLLVERFGRRSHRG